MTRKIITIALVLASFFYSPLIYPESLTPHQLTIDERLSDFYQLINQIKNGYGPKEYKKEMFGIDVDELAKKYWDKMKSAKDNGEFYSLIMKFVAEFKDGHFRANIPTEYKASLPFSVNLVQNRVLIESMYEKIIPRDKFPFERGDELLEIDGRPVGEVIDEFVPYVSDGNPLEARAFATYWTVYRPGTKVPVPTGKISVTIQSFKTGEKKTVSLEWLHRGEPFDEIAASSITAMKALVASHAERPETPQFDITNFSTFDIISDYVPNMENTYHCNPKTRIAIPKDATILMAEPFTAYYYPTPKGNVGYIRIADYYPPDDNKDGKKDYDKWYKHYKWALTNLEKDTIGLIIDQDHNCGGSFSYMEDIISLLMKGEFPSLTFQLRASKQNILKVKSWLDEFDSPYYLDYDITLEIYHLLEDSFNKDLFLTPKTTFHGDKMLNGKAVYTKPVIILIDYFAGSCGDAFPVIMQGLGRAKLLGTTTGGLGGAVVTMTPLFYSQIKTDMTQWLFFKPDGSPVENVGAIPDIPYEITVNDFINGYTDYQRFYTEELLKMIE